MQAPLGVMTDDSAAMKLALKAVWPETRQFLCHFHVGQAEWRWLTSKVNNIPSHERQNLMAGFRKASGILIAYASTPLNSKCVLNAG